MEIRWGREWNNQVVVLHKSVILVKWVVFRVSPSLLLRFSCCYHRAEIGNKR